jgi:hypothetical protein
MALVLARYPWGTGSSSTSQRRFHVFWTCNSYAFGKKLDSLKPPHTLNSMYCSLYAGFGGDESGNIVRSRMDCSGPHRQNHHSHRCRNSLPGCFRPEGTAEKILRLDSWVYVSS